MERNRTNIKSIVIKVRFTNNGETIARKVIVYKYIKMIELEYMLRERFSVEDDKSLELYYFDDGDRVIVTFEEELALAFDNITDVPVFEIIIKPKVVNHVCTYPQIQKGKPGDCVEILVESKYLTLANATSIDTRAWGTHTYTDDSDIVKVLGHSGRIALSDSPPQFNVVIAIRYTKGNIRYTGSVSNGITTMDYGLYNKSFIIENVRTVPAIHEKD